MSTDDRTYVITFKFLIAEISNEPSTNIRTFPYNCVLNKYKNRNGEESFDK